MTRKIRYLAITAGLVLATPAAQALDQAATAAFVQRINKTVETVNPSDRTAVRAACSTLVQQAFDFEAMAVSITGEAWTRMNGKHRASYVKGLTKRAASDCTKSGREIAGNLMELVGVRAGPDGDSNLAVRQSKGKQRTVIWRVRPGAGGALKAVDMTVDGRSLATTARRDAKRILDTYNGDVTQLVRSMGG